MSGPAPRPALLRASPLRTGLLLAALAMLAALAWLGWQRQDDIAIVQREGTARPALWHASKGESSLWLFGTIHAVPKDEPWLSPAIASAVGQSDRLYLEVTGLDAERKSRATFERLGRAGAPLPPIEDRFASGDVAQFRALTQRHGAALRDLGQYKSWAAALLVNAAAASELPLSSAQAGETILARLFERADKPVHGLETIEEQLGLFDSLPEAEQRRLLTQSVREAGEVPQLYAALHGAWASGDIAGLEEQFFTPLAQAPILRYALIDARNERWADLIDTAMRRHPGQAFIAVGAGHLLGEGSVQARLAARGWRIERTQ